MSAQLFVIWILLSPQGHGRKHRGQPQLCRRLPRLGFLSKRANVRPMSLKLVLAAGECPLFFYNFWIPFSLLSSGRSMVGGLDQTE